MGNIWERFEDIEGATQEDVAEQVMKFQPIEEGQYKVRLEELEASESKSGLPMVKGRFRIIAGERENAIIFYNQVIQNINYSWMTAMNIARVTTLLSGIVGEAVEFEGLVELANLIDSIETGLEFTVEIKYGAKDTEKSFPEITVVDDFDDLTLEGFEVTDDDIPF